MALADFVIFPPRWMVAEDTFRPPWFHRNTMSEFMGMIWGSYDAKGAGFVPGGASLHACMSPHGPDAETFFKATTAELKPHHFNGGLAFMFETTLFLKVTQWALHAPHRDVAYQKCWQDLPHRFTGNIVAPSLAEQPRAAGSAAAGSAASAGAGDASGQVSGGGVDDASIDTAAGEPASKKRHTH